MRTGVCHLIHSLSLAKISLTEKERKYYFTQLQENFKHPNIEIQEEATIAYRSFCLAEFNSTIEDDDKVKIAEMIRGMFKPSHFDENIAITRGYNMSFGVLSKNLYQYLNPEIFEILTLNCIAKGKETDDADTRK